MASRCAANSSDVDGKGQSQPRNFNSKHELTMYLFQRKLFIVITVAMKSPCDTLLKVMKREWKGENTMCALLKLMNGSQYRFWFVGGCGDNYRRFDVNHLELIMHFFKEQTAASFKEYDANYIFIDDVKWPLSCMSSLKL